MLRNTSSACAHSPLARAEVFIAVTLQLVASRSGPVATQVRGVPATQTQLLASKTELQLSFAHLYEHEHTYPSQAHARPSTESHLQHEVNDIVLAIDRDVKATYGTVPYSLCVYIQIPLKHMNALAHKVQHCKITKRNGWFLYGFHRASIAEIANSRTHLWTTSSKKKVTSDNVQCPTVTLIFLHSFKRA